MKFLFTFLLSISFSILKLKAQSTPNNLSDYVWSNPSQHQFDKSFANGTGSAAILNNKLNLTRAVEPGADAPNGISITRNTSMGIGTAKVLQISFDVQASSNGQTANSFGCYFVLGSLRPDHGDNTATPGDAVSTLKLRFGFNNTNGELTIANFRNSTTIAGATSALNMSGNRSIHFDAIINLTDNSVGYTTPNAAASRRTLASGKIDMFVDGVLPPYTGTGDLVSRAVPTGFKISLNTHALNISFDNIIIKDATGVVLPVDLISFTGKSTNDGIALNWATASEQNSDYFEISKYNTNSQNYTPVAKVNAAGNSNSKINYQYTDAQAQQGVNYYQLKQVDKDGIYKTYSPITVNYKLNTFKFEVFKSEENSIKYSAFFDKQQNVEFSLMSLEGKVLSQKTVLITPGYNTGVLATSFLNSGLYLVRLKYANGQSFVNKLMVSSN